MQQLSLAHTLSIVSYKIILSVCQYVCVSFTISLSVTEVSRYARVSVSFTTVPSQTVVFIIQCNSQKGQGPLIHTLQQVKGSAVKPLLSLTFRCACLLSQCQVLKYQLNPKGFRVMKNSTSVARRAGKDNLSKECTFERKTKNFRVQQRMTDRVTTRPNS